MIPISFLRRFLGLDRADDGVAVPMEPPLPPPKPVEAPPPAVVTCPNCAFVLDPPPTSTRLCPRCRRRIVVRRMEGRTIYLTEAAVEVFVAERHRDAEEHTWTRQRKSWLQLAQLVGAPLERRARLAKAPLTEATVHSARTLYLAAADRAVAAARREKRWDDVARIRRRQAAALFEDAGSVPPPADEILALHREGIAATLRELAPVSREVELVGSSCCSACRRNDEQVFRIADELRVPRLPHAGCPRGLCACDWWPVMRAPAKKRRRPASAAVPPAPAHDAHDSPGAAPDGDPTEGDGADAPVR